MMTSKAKKNDNDAYERGKKAFGVGAKSKN